MTPSKTPSKHPTKQPTTIPTAPSSEPSEIPTKHPTQKPTIQPTDTTLSPSPSPTQNPTPSPTQNPTPSPTSLPSKVPTSRTGNPTPSPTSNPTHSPTPSPTIHPTPSPTSLPTPSPTHTPTPPTKPPTMRPTKSPTLPTLDPTKRPTQSPTNPCEQYYDGDYYDTGSSDNYCKAITIYPQTDVMDRYKIDISMDQTSQSQQKYAYWTVGGDSADCLNPKIEISTDPKVLITNDAYLNVYERPKYYYSDLNYLGRCDYDESNNYPYRACNQFETCLSYNASYNIYAGQTYGISVQLYDNNIYSNWKQTCSDILGFELILICNPTEYGSGSTKSAAISIILFILCLLYMIPVLIWAILYFFANNGTLPSFRRRKQPGIKQSAIGIWRGTNILQKLSLFILDPLDILSDFGAAITINSSAATKPNPALWRTCGGFSIFALIMGLILTLFQFKIYRRFMPCIAKWKKMLKDKAEEVKTLKKTKNGDELKAEWTNKWNEIKKTHNRINKYLAHLTMFALFGAAIEDSIQCAINFRLQWSSLVQSENGLELYYNGNGWLWFKTILALFGMIYKLFAAATIKFLCHQESLDLDLKPDDADSDRDDEEPLTAQTFIICYVVRIICCFIFFLLLVSCLFFILIINTFTNYLLQFAIICVFLRCLFNYIIIFCA